MIIYHDFVLDCKDYVGRCEICLCMGVYLIVGCLGLTCISIGKQYAKRSIENACEI